MGTRLPHPFKVMSSSQYPRFSLQRQETGQQPGRGGAGVQDQLCPAEQITAIPQPPPPSWPSTMSPLPPTQGSPVPG